MRVLGFTKKWEKLRKSEFTTFRLPRKDKDWRIWEDVQIVYHPRSKDREVLFLASITDIHPCYLTDPSAVTDRVAVEDGFSNRIEMLEWFKKTHGDVILTRRMNKLILKKLEVK